MDITFSDAETIRNELEKGSGICRPGKVSEDILRQSAEEWFLDLPSESEHLCHSASGDLVLSIRNESYGGNDPRTRGPNTNRKLGFHTDRCGVIGFLCLQPAKTGGENHVVSSLAIERIIRTERPILHKVLCLPFPYKRHVVDKGNDLPYCEQPIFSWKNNFFACSYLRVLIDRADKDSQCPSLSGLQRESLDFLIRFANAKTFKLASRSKEASLYFSTTGPLFTAEPLLRTSQT